MRKALENLGASALNALEQTGRTFLLLTAVLWQMLQPPYRFYPIVRQMYFIGARSITLIVISGITIGRLTSDSRRSRPGKR